MANREELSIIRGARGGRLDAQLQLGKLYLFGSAGLPRSLPTALHWLERAARQDSEEACLLIGAHIPLDLARRGAWPLALYYAVAAERGDLRAGLVFAQLVLVDGQGGADSALRARATRCLQAAANAGIAEAQWLLPAEAGEAAPDVPAAPPAAEAHWPRHTEPLLSADQAAELDRFWQRQQWDAWLQAALPLARALLAADGAQPLHPGAEEAQLLSRCARLLAAGHGQASADELRRCRELAAAANDRHAQLALGLWYARMEVDGRRTAVGAGSANFKKAIRWLSLAGEQGLAEAWYALSRIYIKPEFSQRNVGDAQRYLEKAAEMGYREAQLECGTSAWRSRREHDNNDVRALYWLHQAARQGCPRAAASLRKAAPRGAIDPDIRAALAGGALLAGAHPLLAARLELGALFHLTRAEALLLDIPAADRGHCLVIDIRSSYGRSKRRLVVVETAQERLALDRIVRLFDNVESGPGGPEGNYRQRLYRLKTVTPPAGNERYELAA